MEGLEIAAEPEGLEAKAEGEGRVDDADLAAGKQRVAHRDQQDLERGPRQAFDLGRVSILAPASCGRFRSACFSTAASGLAPSRMASPPSDSAAPGSPQPC